MNLILALLLSLLDSNSFRIRDAATAALARLAPVAWRQLYHVSGPLETQLRCKAVANHHWPAIPLAERQAYVAGFVPRGWKILPWLDLRHPGDYFSTGGAGASGCWLGWRMATEAWLLEVAGTMLPAAIRAELERMADVELAWIAANPWSYRSAGGLRRHH